MLSHLENKGLRDLIKDLRSAMKASRKEVKASLENREKKRASEEAMKEAQKRKPRTAATSPRKKKKAEEQLEKEAKKQSEVTGEPVEKSRERITEQTAKEPYKVGFEAVPDGPVFRGERMGSQYKLIVNTRHQFYDDVYEPARSVAGLRSKLEAAMFVIVEAELDAEAEQESFYRSGRVYLSQRLTDVLAVLDGTGESDDEKSAEMEDEESMG